MICTFLLLWTAAQAVSPEAVQHMKAGIEANKHEHFEIAIVEFRKATELAPDLAEAFVGLGRAYMENGDPPRHGHMHDRDVEEADDAQHRRRARATGRAPRVRA